MIHLPFTCIFILYGIPYSLTSFLPGDVSPITVLEFRRFPFTFRRFSDRNGSTIIVIIFLPQPSSIRNPMSAVIIPSVDADIKHNAAYQKRDQRPIFYHLSNVYVERKAMLKNLNATLYIVIGTCISLYRFFVKSFI